MELGQKIRLREIKMRQFGKQTKLGWNQRVTKIVVSKVKPLQV